MSINDTLIVDDDLIPLLRNNSPLKQPHHDISNQIVYRPALVNFRLHFILSANVIYCIIDVICYANDSDMNNSLQCFCFYKYKFMLQ